MLLLASALLAIHLQPVSPTSPNRQPQLASANGFVAMVFGSGDSIWFSGSREGGRTWTRPVKVAELPKLLLGRHRGPRVVISVNTIIVSAIASEPGDLIMWRSQDRGQSWSKAIEVNDRPKAAREGLHAMAADVEGHVAAVWLDDRTPDDGSPIGKRLYGAFSNDAGATWSKNALLYKSPGRTICECCAPSVASVGGGEFVAMWRNAMGGSRDMYTIRLRDGKIAGPAEKAGTGTWKVDACPMDGGGIAVWNGRVATGWRRDHNVYIAEAGQKESVVGYGQDVAFAANSQGFYAAWSNNGGISIQMPDAVGSLRASDVGAFPALVAVPDGAMLVAWEENGTIATKRFQGVIE